MDKTADKAAMRRKVLTLRNTLAPEEIAAKSDRITALLTTIPRLREAATVMLFCSFGSEFRTDELFRWGWAAGKRTAVPLCRPAERGLTPCRIDSFAELETGRYGIREPKREAVRPVPPGEIDLVLVPAVAFDRRGQRIGYGGGYYDRFLPAVPRAVRIGAAFSCQIVERVPADAHDLPVDRIVTEDGEIPIFP